MSKFINIVTKEIFEALPAMIFFLILFHLIGTSKAVILNDYSFTAMRAVGATMGALIVAKAVLIVETLPIGHYFSSRRILNMLWRTLMYSLMALLFHFLEELIPYIIKHGEILSGIKTMIEDITWIFFAVMTAWIVFGLFLFTLITELVELVGRDKLKNVLFSRLDNQNT